MGVYFCNEERIDLDVIRLMGVSVKTSGVPIGFFGTGLKFAIATLLRTGHKIELIRGGTLHNIGTESRNVRGEDFQVVTLDGEQLAFTTELGKNWEPWMAYRELHSNCLDESGVISSSLPVGDWGTIIKVSGEGAEAAYRNRSSIFLDRVPEFRHPDAEIHKTGDCSQVGFYRGIRAVHLDKPSIHTYNVTAGLELTEDRTVKNDFMFKYYVVNGLLSCDDKRTIEQAIMASDEFFESTLDFSGQLAPSLAFISACEENRQNYACMNRSAHRVWLKHTGEKAILNEARLDSFRESEISEALSLLRALDCDLERSGFIVVESLGTSTFGCVRDGQIFIDKKTLDRGIRFIASTLYEEWIHKQHGYRDCSRQMQDMLLDRLLFFVDRNSKANHS